MSKRIFKPLYDRHKKKKSISFIFRVFYARNTQKELQEREREVKEKEQIHLWCVQVSGQGIKGVSISGLFSKPRSPLLTQFTLLIFCSLQYAGKIRGWCATPVYYWRAYVTYWVPYVSEHSPLLRPEVQLYAESLLRSQNTRLVLERQWTHCVVKLVKELKKLMLCSSFALFFCKY